MRNKVSVTLLIYGVLAVILFPFYRYYAISDFVPYADIAAKYLNGNFHDAINGIWGPLISWLLIPFLWLKMDPLFSFKILSLLIGGVSIFALSRLMKKFSLNEKIEWFLLLLLIPIVLSFAFVHTTPDLLVATILMFYLDTIFNPKYGSSTRLSVLAGFLGALAYFAKHYAFPFIAIHLMLTGIFKYFSTKNKKQRKKLIVNIAISYFVFLAISGVWIFAQSYKYNYFTIGTSGAYNHAWMSQSSLGHATQSFGLLPPPNPSANGAWEDLTYYTHLMPGHDWSMFNSWSEFSYQVKLVTQNLKETFVILNKFAIIVGPLILLWSILYVVKNKKNEILTDNVFLSLVVITLYSSGYLLIRSSDRYIWIAFFLILLLGGSILNEFYKSTRSNKKLVLTILLIIFSLSFLFTPLRRFQIDIYMGKDIYDLSLQLKQQNIQGNIASNTNGTNTYILSHFLEATCFGTPLNTHEKEALSEELKNSEIDYYFQWNDSSNPFNSKEEYPVIKKGNLSIYKLK